MNNCTSKPKYELNINTLEDLQSDGCTTLLCERCKNSNATITCDQCSPFRNFCDECNKIIHELPSRKDHLINKNNNKGEVISKIQNNLNNVIDSSINDTMKNYEILEGVMGYNELNNSKVNNSNNYTKEYVNELKNIFEKEKSELLFKIKNLENTLDRLKISFNNQINSLQDNNIYNEKETHIKIKAIQENLNTKIKEIEYQKNNEINTLTAQLNFEKGNKDKIYKTLQNTQEQYNYLQNESNEQIKDLFNQINEIRDEYSSFKINSNKNINKIQDDYENKIKQIKQNYEKEIIDLKLSHKLDIEKIDKSLTNKYEEIINESKTENRLLKEKNIQLANDSNKLANELVETKNKLNKIIDDLKTEQKKLSDELDNIKNDKIKLDKDYNELNKLNKTCNKIIIEKNDENARLMQEMSYYKNAIKSMKINQDVLKDKYNKLQNDHSELTNHTNNMTLEYNNKIKNFDYIEERNNMLERENNNLKEKFSLFENF